MHACAASAPNKRNQSDIRVTVNSLEASSHTRRAFVHHQSSSIYVIALVFSLRPTPAQHSHTSTIIVSRQAGYCIILGP
jgi:hypothetical protein